MRSRRFTPVSYTHLDVYKRQVRDYPDWIKDTVRLKRPVTAESFAVPAQGCADAPQAPVRVIRLIDGQIINEEDRAMPVSYTHLDVYKRQSLWRLRTGLRRGNCSRPRRLRP